MFDATTGSRLITKCESMAAGTCDVRDLIIKPAPGALESRTGTRYW